MTDALIRWLVLLLLLLASAGMGFVKGGAHAQKKFDALLAKQAAAETELLAKRTTATAKVELKFAPQLTRIRTITKETIKNVPTFVSTSDCPMGPGFRLLHDASAKGELPDASRIADAASVSAPVVAGTVADNYGTCLENAKKLEGLQRWINDQLNFNPKEKQ